MPEKRDGYRLDQLKQWAEATEKEIEEINAALAPLEHRLQAARERLDLLHRLARLTESAQEQLLESARESVGQPPSPVAAPQDLESGLEQILRGADQPMHISDIRKALVERAIPLPGRGDEANIIVRLRRAPERFIRTGRGMYALTALGLDAVPPTKRRRRVRARKMQ